MNLEQALQQFSKENFSFLTSLEFTKEELKERRRSFFFERFKNKYGMPELRDIAEAVIKFQRDRGVSCGVLQEQLDSLPLFQLIGENTRFKISTSLSPQNYRSSLPEQDIKLLQKVNAFEALKRLKGEELEKQYEQELSSLKVQIDNKRQEYDTLPSVIDSDSIEEPEFDPTVDEVRLWWERFYLRGNPFENKDGLSKVPSDLYEEVVVKTEPFQLILGSLAKNPNCLFNTASLLVGNFGFGKTTFMDYLSYYLIRQNVLPVRISCLRAFPNVSGFQDNFLIGLKNQLYKQLQQIEPFTSDLLSEQTIERQISILCERILTRKSGIMVFMDDYHKHQSDAKTIYEFLGTLQILKDDLTRESHRIGFIVSGIEEWLQELRQRPQMSGFLDSPPIVMPKIDAKKVCDVFNHRLDAYSYEKASRRIRLEFVERIVRETNPMAGYRDFITRIIVELENNNFAIVDSPIELEEAELEEIRSEIESDSAVKGNIGKLMLESRFSKYTNEQIAKCLELLVQIEMQDGVLDSDAMVRENAYYFRRLRECTLIQKKRHSGSNSFKWVIHHSIRQRLVAIQTKFHRNISDYFLKIYAWKGYGNEVPQAKAQMASEILNSKSLLLGQGVSLPVSVRQHVEEAFRFCDVVLAAEESPSRFALLVDNANWAVTHLSLAIFDMDKSSLHFSSACINELGCKWDLHPLYSESIGEFFRRLKRFHEEKSRETAEFVLKQAIDAIPVLLNHLNAIVRDICDQNTRVPFYDRMIRFNESDYRVFELARSDYYSADRDRHFRYVSQMTIHLEDRLRKFLYCMSSLVFGLDDYHKHLPKSDQLYAHRNLANKTNYSSVDNIFHGLTRPQFRPLFTDTGNDIRNLVVRPLDIPWQSDDWSVFFDIFVLENINTSHQQNQTYSSMERTRYIKYIEMASVLLEYMNRSAATVLPTRIFAEEIEHSSGLSGLFFYTSFCPKREWQNNEMHLISSTKTAFESSALHRPQILTPEAYNNVHGIVLSELSLGKYVLLDILDPEFICTHYGVSYPEFIYSISYMMLFDKRIEILPWFGSSVMLVITA